jgi:hypothetical protein
MPRASSIDQMPEGIRSEIGRLRTQGVTIDGIIEHLRQLHGAAPSRSALGRHIRGLDKLGEKMRRSRDVASALVRELGDAPESTAARVNIELIHTAVLDLFVRAGEGEMIDGDGAAALAGNPEGVMMLAKALDHLARASKTNVDFIAAAEARAAARAKTEAASVAETVARERGISGDTIEAIKRGIFGVKAG